MYLKPNTKDYFDLKQVKLSKKNKGITQYAIDNKNSTNTTKKTTTTETTTTTIRTTTTARTTTTITPITSTSTKRTTTISHDYVTHSMGVTKRPIRKPSTT